VFHLPRLEDPTLRIDQRNALAVELEPAREISGIDHPASYRSEPIHMIEGDLADLSVVSGGVHGENYSSQNVSETGW
jgi:hypothetical protein